MSHRERRAAVYRVVHRSTGRDYIGVSVDPKRRWRDHKLAATKGSALRFPRALAKYGFAAFDWTIVCWCRTYELALELERAARFVGMGYYNMTAGGEGMLGWSPSQETRAKSATARRGVRRSIQARARMSVAKKGRPALNREVPMSPAQLSKIKARAAARFDCVHVWESEGGSLRPTSARRRERHLRRRACS